MSQDRAYFISDAHLGQGDASVESRKVERLESFLAHVRAHPGHLYIAGDLFDFWFEYRHAIPRGHTRILAALSETRRAGVPVTYVCGNHDFWVDDYLTRELGIQVAQEPLRLEIQGKRVWVAHGDGLLSGDTGYRVLKAVFRFRPFIWMYRWLHPDIGIPLAKAVSRGSRDSQVHSMAVPMERIRREIVDPRFAEGYDIVVLGHFHMAVHERVGAREFVILGEWITRGDAWVMEGGRMGRCGHSFEL